VQDEPITRRTDANVDRVRTNCESTVLFGSADKVTGICSEENPELCPDKWILSIMTMFLRMVS
jgi:hypothetical protein